MGVLKIFNRVFMTAVDSGYIGQGFQSLQVAQHLCGSAFKKFAAAGIKEGVTGKESLSNLKGDMATGMAGQMNNFDRYIGESY